MKDRVYVPPLPHDLTEWRHKNEKSINSMIPDLLTKAFEELDCKLDVCRIILDWTFLRKFRFVYLKFDVRFVKNRLNQKKWSAIATLKRFCPTSSNDWLPKLWIMYFYRKKILLYFFLLCYIFLHWTLLNDIRENSLSYLKKCFHQQNFFLLRLQESLTKSNTPSTGYDILLANTSRIIFPIWASRLIT